MRLSSCRPFTSLSAGVTLAVLLATQVTDIGAKENGSTLRVQFYPSAMVGIKERQARAATEPFLRWLGDRLDRRFQLDFERNGDTLADLRTFGHRISRSSGYLGVITGIEYGWLKNGELQEKFELEPLVVTKFSGDERAQTRIMVRNDSSANAFSDLKGQSFADFKSMPLADRVFLLAKIREYKFVPADFLVRPRAPYPTAKSSLFAVNGGDADYTVVSAYSQSRIVANHPTFKLRAIAISEEFPSQVIVANRRLIASIHKDLWSNLKRELLLAKQTAYGRECCKFWWVDEFIEPNDGWRQLVASCAKSYPLTLLDDLTELQANR